MPRISIQKLDSCVCVVKTLAIRSTAEEVMVSRRDAFLKNDKQPKLTEDARIRDFIAVRMQSPLYNIAAKRQP